VPPTALGDAEHATESDAEHIPVAVVLVHRADLQPCPHDLYCPQGRVPFCTRCQQPDGDHQCEHLRDFRDELDFDC
jgi:hypothetical protein